MRAEHFLYINNSRIKSEDLVPVKIAFMPTGGLGCCPFLGGGSVVVDLLFIGTPIVGVCNCSVLLYVTLCPF